MNVERVAAAFHISRAKAYEAVKTGEIPSIKIGKRVVVPTAAVRRMLLLDGGTDAA
jgi:excisionase family DNA binding protein